MKRGKWIFRTDHRGFSLVELIIVISIMAVLSAVLVPMYLSYVEKANIAKDIDTLDKIHKAFELEYALGGYNDATLLTDVFGQSITNNAVDMQYKGEKILALNQTTGKVKLEPHTGSTPMAPGNFIYDSLAAAGLDMNTLCSGGEIKLFKSKAALDVARSSNARGLWLSIHSSYLAWQPGLERRSRCRPSQPLPLLFA